MKADRSGFLNALCRDERGNALIMVFLGVALFGLLSFMVARTMRSESTGQLSARDADLAAADILGYAQQIERAVNRLRQDGCSENDISFESEQWGHNEYEHSTAAPNRCKVFHSAGGGVAWRDIDSQYNSILTAANAFIIAGRTHIVGFGDTDCATAACADLYIFMRMIHAETLCRKINALGSLSDTLPVVTGLYGTPRYSGSFSDGVIFGNAGNGPLFAGKPFGCYRDNSETHSDGSPFYDFYYVLIAR